MKQILIKKVFERPGKIGDPFPNLSPNCNLKREKAASWISFQIATPKENYLETHIQFPAQTDQSASKRFSRKNRRPSSQLIHKSPRVKKQARAFLFHKKRMHNYCLNNDKETYINNVWCFWVIFDPHFWCWKSTLKIRCWQFFLTAIYGHLTSLMKKSMHFL